MMKILAANHELPGCVMFINAAPKMLLAFKLESYSHIL